MATIEKVLGNGENWSVAIVLDDVTNDTGGVHVINLGLDNLIVGIRIGGIDLKKSFPPNTDEIFSFVIRQNFANIINRKGESGIIVNTLQNYSFGHF